VLRRQHLVKLDATPDELEADPMWDIQTSIYARRGVESEGKSFFDMTPIYRKRLSNDWGNAIHKQRFMKVPPALRIYEKKFRLIVCGH